MVQEERAGDGQIPLSEWLKEKGSKERMRKRLKRAGEIDIEKDKETT